MSSDHTKRLAAQDARNEAGLRIRALAQQEQHAREAMLHRLVGALVQRKEPHHFHEAHVRERISPRRPMDVPDQPGELDVGGFEGAIC